jgi:hypothetical protein
MGFMSAATLFSGEQLQQTDDQGFYFVPTVRETHSNDLRGARQPITALDNK